MNNILNDVFVIAVVSVVTIFTRAIPFILFPGDRKIPKPIIFLSKVLPCSVMGMLIIYCLKDVSVISAPYGIPEFISIAVVVGLYLWKKNTLLSILTGTVCYMLLIQFIFI